MKITRPTKKNTGAIIERHPYSPFALMREMDNIFDAVRSDFDQMFMHPFASRFASHAMENTFRAPPMDFRDEGERFVLVAEIPGMKKDDVEITLTDDHIEIAAEVKEEKNDSGECYICKERSYRSFKRVFQFPEEIVSENTEAKLENGVLEIVMPKKEPAPKKEARKLEIK